MISLQFPNCKLLQDLRQSVSEVIVTTHIAPTHFMPNQAKQSHCLRKFNQIEQRHCTFAKNIRYSSNRSDSINRADTLLHHKQTIATHRPGPSDMKTGLADAMREENHHSSIRNERDASSQQTHNTPLTTQINTQNGPPGSVVIATWHKSNKNHQSSPAS